MQNAVDENKIEPSIFRYILKHTKKDQILLLLMTLLSMPFVYAALEIPKIIINSALGGVNIPDKIFGYSMDQVKYLILLCCAFLVLVLINGGLKYVINVYRGILGERMLRRFRFDLFSRLLRFPVPRFKQVSQGEIIPMITAETEPLGGFIGDAFALPAFQGGLLITYLAFIFNQDVLLGLAAIALYPPQLYLIPKLQRRVNQLAKQRVKAVRTFSDKVGETVSGITDIHVNNTSRYEKAHVSSRLARIYSIRFEIYKKKFFIKFLNNFLAQLTPFFFYGIGGYFVIKGELSLGALVAVLAAYKDLSSPWKELLKFYQITEDVRVKYKQIIEQFQPENMLNPAHQHVEDEQVKFIEAAIEASAVSYSEDEFVKSLDSVSFSVSPGQHVAVLGIGGSGRGVLTQLVARILKPSFGKIKIAENDISELTESALGRHIAYVDQQSYVFTGTIEENLLYGLKDQPMNESDAAVKEPETRKNYIKDALLSANSEDDAQANWINTHITGVNDQQQFNQHILSTLKLAGIEDDVYQLGLYSLIDGTKHPHITEGILQARQQFREKLQQVKSNKLVETLDEHLYNTNMSVAENLLFGMPVEYGSDIESILSNTVVQDAIEQAQLKLPLVDIGLQAAKIMIDIFSDVPEGSPLFERFSFVSLEDLPELARLARLSEVHSVETFSEDDSTILMSLAYKLNQARHRLGLLTPDIQEKVIHAHTLIKEKLGDPNQLIEFYSQDKLARHLTIQDNILFGRVAYGQANARQKVGKLIQDVITDLGLKQQIIEVGLDYSVGVGGAKLTSTQRQKLTLARALIKNPHILVVNEATAILDAKVETRLIKEILASMKNTTILWVLSNNDYIEQFDSLLLLDKGKLVAEGEVGKLMQDESFLKQIS